MGRTIQIEVPEWVDAKEIETLKQMLITALEEKMKNKAEINVYRIYFVLKYPESESETKNFSLDEELGILEEIRKKEKKRVSK